MIRAASNALLLIFRSLFEFVRPALIATIVVVFGIALIVGIGGLVVDNWGGIVCWANDETGNLGRICALHKVSQSKNYEDSDVIEVTGIAEISENVKRVEFKWRYKPTAENPNPQQAEGAITFRKYDDGWRPEE
jgi:hypothetical protein